MNQRGGSHGLDVVDAWSTEGLVMTMLLFAMRAADCYAGSVHTP
jgi:hypothetical protein